MSKFFKFGVFIVVVVACGFLFFISPESILPSQICLENNCFLVKVMKTDFERSQGLMFQESLGKNEGMLFIFEEEDIYPFWMKNTLIPLDIIWINKDNRVVFINENSQPCTLEDCQLIDPGIDAKYVLEINAGVSKKAGIKTGDVVELNFDLNK